MYINDIPSNTDIKLLVHSKENTMEFLTSSLEMNEVLIRFKNAIENKLKSKILIVELVRQDGTAVNFNTSSIFIDAEVIIDNKEYLWHRVIVSNIDIPSIGRKAIIISNDDISFNNRRENFRVNIGLSATIMVGYNRKTDDAIVKDLSNNGIGLIVDNNTNGTVGENIRISFDDSRRKASFHIDCTIVRVEQITERRKLYGCSINAIKPNPNYYINLIQREQLNRK